MGSDAVKKSSDKALSVRIGGRNVLLCLWVVATVYLIYVALHPLAPAVPPNEKKIHKRWESGWVEVPVARSPRREQPSRSDTPRRKPTKDRSPKLDSPKYSARAAAVTAVEVGDKQHRVPPYLEHMQAAGMRGRYMDIVVHKGFTNQVFALLNGLAIAHLLNVTLVLPAFSTNYAHQVYAGFDIQKMQFDPSLHDRVPMSDVFDVESLREAVSPWVRIVPELPDHLKGDSLFGRIPASLVNPKRPETLRPYLAELRDSLVLRTKCPLSSVVWNTPELGQLRRAAIAALAPGWEVKRLMDARLALLSELAPQGYIGLHLRVEDDWVEHCKSQSQNPAKTQIESFEECWSDGETVAGRLAQAVRFQPSSQHPSVVYVATGQYDQDFSSFYRRGFTILSPANFSRDALRGDDGENKRDLAAAVDYFILRSSKLFIGNIFSSFSFSIRENFLYEKYPSEDSLNCFYYNDPSPKPLLDITPTEALRWRVMSGTAYPEFYASTEATAQSASYRSLLCRVSGASPCTPSRVSSISITSVKATDHGYVVVNGAVMSTGVPWIHTLQIAGPSTGPIRIAANDPIYKESPEKYLFEFAFRGDPERTNKFVICTIEGLATTCTNPQAIAMKPPLQRPEIVPFGSGGGTVFIYTGASSPSGGVESLHKLNAVINSEYEKGHIAIRSKLQNGQEAYRAAMSDYVDDVTSRDLGPNDVFMVPERLDKLPSWWQYVFDETGALPMQYILGQHTTKLRVDRIGKDGFQSVCLTQYFASGHDCPPKAVMTSAFDENWLVVGREFRNLYHPKHDARIHSARDQRVCPHRHLQENIILLDEDKTLHLDPLQIQVPGAQVVVLKDLSKAQIVDYYKRAKLNLDTYITGRERALFEGSLFNVIPVIKYHAAGTDPKAFPLPKEWTWDSWDYDVLNAQLAELLATYSEQVPKLEPMINTIESWSDKFPEQVSSFFGDNVHVMLSALGENCDMESDARVGAMLAAVFVLFQYPFATVEILAHNKYYFEYDFASVLDLLYLRGMERRITVSQVAPEYRRLCGVAVFLQPPKARQRRKHALIVPPGGLPMEADLIVSLLEAQASETCDHRHFRGGSAGCRAEGVSLEGGMLLVEQSSYYGAVDTLATRVPDAAPLARMRPYLEQLDITIQEVTITELRFFKKYPTRCSRYPLCSGSLQFFPWDPASLASMSPECRQACVCDNVMPILDTQTIAAIRKMFGSSPAKRALSHVEALCQ